MTLPRVARKRARGRDEAAIVLIQTVAEQFGRQYFLFTMTIIEVIRGFRNATPFSPFDLILRDGRKVHVALPERMAMAPNGQKLGVYEGIMPTLVEVASIDAWPRRESASAARGANDDATNSGLTSRLTISSLCPVPH